MPDPVEDQENLCYPIGRFVAPAAVTPVLCAEQIETLRQMPERLREAVQNLDSAQLDTPYREGGWTVRQVVHHLADSHANSFIRYRRVLTEDNPALTPYDEAAWARLPDNCLPVEGSLTLIEALHTRWTALLRAMSGDDFLRDFEHPVLGRQNLAYLLMRNAWHARHHTAHITSLRQRRGW